MVVKKSNSLWSMLDNPKWYWLLLFRLLNLAIVKTWFVPDEYFQSFEVAYQKVYRIGHLSWEWKPDYALRSYLHPGLFILMFYPLKLLHLDSNLLIRLLPNLLHVILFAISDHFMAKLLNRLFDTKDRQAIRYSYLIYLSNWFVLFCAPRTLSNSLETVLTIIGLHFYPLEPIKLILKKNSGYPFMGYSICAALACLIRPTSALIWAPLGIYHIYQSRNPVLVLFKHLLPPAILVAVLTAALDIFMYGRLTLPAWNFINFNVLSAGSANFGVHPVYWYLTEGFPPVFTLAVYPIIFSSLEVFSTMLYNNKDRQQIQSVKQAQKYQPTTNLLFCVAIFYVTFHSFIAHKEHRFLLPIIPLIVAQIGSYLCRMKRYGKLLFWSTVILQIPLILYFGLAHQKAPAEIIDYLNNNLNDQLSKGTYKNETQISQLMPCYSMPQYAAIHPYGLRNVEFFMIDCTPNFKNTTFPGNSQDQSDLFHYDPLNFVRTNWKYIGQSGYIIAYERPFKQLEAFLRSHGFSETARFYNTRFPVSSRQDPYIIVATRTH